MSERTDEGKGAYGVMCCGCYRVLGVDGQLLSTGGGFVPWGDMALFTSHEAADKEAAGLGWIVRDAHGPNHRCPECVANPKSLPVELAPFKGTSGRGAYLKVPPGVIRGH